MVDVAPSENRAALAARGCDEPGLAAVAGVVVTGAGAAVTGAAAVAGERCLVAMFAPRPLLTASVKTTVRSFQIAAAPFRRTRSCAASGSSLAGALRPVSRLLVGAPSSTAARLTAVTKLLVRASGM